MSKKTTVTMDNADGILYLTRQIEHYKSRIDAETAELEKHPKKFFETHSSNREAIRIRILFLKDFVKTCERQLMRMEQHPSATLSIEED